MPRKQEPLKASFKVGQYVKSFSLPDIPPMLVLKVKISQFHRTEFYVCQLPDGTQKEFCKSDLKKFINGTQTSLNL